MYPPEIDKQDELATIETIKHWSLAHGLVMLTEGNSSTAVHAPVTLYPTPFPKPAFNQAIAIQKLYNELYYSVCINTEWIEQILTELSGFDPEFTGRLLDIHFKSVKDGVTQPLTGGLFRSDYILNEKRKIKQVEFNCVSVSFGGLSTKVSELHK